MTRLRSGLVLFFVALVAVLAIISLNGCGGLDHGTVTGKEYEEGYYYQSIIPMSCGTNCTMMVPTTMYDDPDWVLSLEACDDPDKPRDCKTGNAYVDEDTYNSLEIGDYYGQDPKEHIDHGEEAG
jgi:hypothetical protein